MADGTGDPAAAPALRAFAQRYREPLLTVDPGGVIRYANPRADDLFCPPDGGDALEGRPATDLLAPRDAIPGADGDGARLLDRLDRAGTGAPDSTPTDDGAPDNTADERGSAATADAGGLRLTGRTTGGGAVSVWARVHGAPDGSYALTLRTAASAAGQSDLAEEAADRARQAPRRDAPEDDGERAGESMAAGRDAPPGEAVATPADQAALLRAFETAADGIAVLDADERYRYVNPAHADLYGVDDPAAMIGDRWTSLYDEAEQERVRAEAMTALRTDGEWRGEAVGRRIDGERFQQELALSALPDGGVVCVVRDRSARNRHERSLEALRAATRDLLAAGDREAVAAVGVRAAAEALELPLSALFLYDEDRHALEPAAVTDAARETFETIPTFTGEADSLAWRAFETGEPQRFEDSGEATLYNEATPASAELIVPLGEHGVMLAGYVEAAEFDPEQARLLHTLAATVTTALDRVESAERLRERNEQLEQFSNALSHDLRNPLNTARATLALARTGADGDTLEYLDDLEETHRRMEALVEDVLALSEAPTDPDTSTVDLAELAEESWRTACSGAPDATLELEPLGIVEAAPGQLRRLLENLFANAVEHGSTSSRAGPDDAAEHAGPDVTVTVGRLPPTADEPGGFYVADDGPGIPPEEREQVFDRGYTSGGGTGLGLDIVRRAADAHGWTVSIGESAAGGAQFEVRGPEPTETD